MSRHSVILAAVACAALPLLAQFFNFGRLRHIQNAEVSGRACLEPAEVVVGEPCAIVLELETDKDVGIENLQVGGLPDAGDDERVSYGEFENLSDGKSAKAGRAVRRFRLPARFLAPCTQDVAVVVQGMAVTRRQQGGMSFSSSSSFRANLAPFSLKVQSLPSNGRPANYQGAVGTRFQMTQSLSPDHVHPGDLVTATYTLTFDGYCPSNVWPGIEHLSREFKTYDPKEVSRTGNKVVWTQMLVPRTATATNSALVSMFYYNIRTKRYEVARAYPKKLVFVSDAAASTENTSVVVATEKPMEPAGAERSASSAEGPIMLRIAPADESPVVIVLPPGTPVVERARSNGWRRLESARAIGWSR